MQARATTAATTASGSWPPRPSVRGWLPTRFPRRFIAFRRAVRCTTTASFTFTTPRPTWFITVTRPVIWARTFGTASWYSEPDGSIRHGSAATGSAGPGLGASVSATATGEADGFGGRLAVTGGITISGMRIASTVGTGIRNGTPATRNGFITTATSTIAGRAIPSPARRVRRAADVWHGRDSRTTYTPATTGRFGTIAGTVGIARAATATGRSPSRTEDLKVSASRGRSENPVRANFAALVPASAAACRTRFRAVEGSEAAAGADGAILATRFGGLSRIPLFFPRAWGSAVVGQFALWGGQSWPQAAF